MIKVVAFLLLLLLLQPTQSMTNAVDFDLHSGYCHDHHWFFGCRKWVEDHSNCVFWLKNGNNYGSINGMGGPYTKGNPRWGRIELNGGLSNSEHTYVWTTCPNSLWIDRMRVFTYDSRQNQWYGANNHKGFCLSYNKNPGSSWMLKYIPAGRCYRMFKMGKVVQKDKRVWGYTSHFRYMPGRRALTEEDVQEVRDCEASATDITSECQHLVKKFMDPMASDSEGWNLVQPMEDMAALFERFDKTDEGEVDNTVMINILSHIPSDENDAQQLLVARADLNGNGSIDFEEFQSMLGSDDEHVNMSHFQEFLRIANVDGLKQIQ